LRADREFFDGICPPPVGHAFAPHKVVRLKFIALSKLSKRFETIGAKSLTVSTHKPFI
jgi:hypothetical protein